MINTYFFDTPIRSGKVRNDVYYYQYRNGIIDIAGVTFVMYSIKDAVKIWRNRNKIK
jgi:hypothetical protein